MHREPTGSRSGVENKSVCRQPVSVDPQGTLTIQVIRLILSSPPAGGED
jgi:hypothetical protein